MEQFIDQILKNLTQNGFPQKKVSLPTEKMYEIADSKGLSLNAVLDKMREEHQIDTVIDTERIVFSLSQAGSDMFAQAQEMMKDMDPAELQRIKDMVENMDPEQRAQMMEQAKSMFQ